MENKINITAIVRESYIWQMQYLFRVKLYNALEHFSTDKKIKFMQKKINLNFYYFTWNHGCFGLKECCFFFFV